MHYVIVRASKGSYSTSVYTAKEKEQVDEVAIVREQDLYANLSHEHTHDGPDILYKDGDISQQGAEQKKVIVKKEIKVARSWSGLSLQMEKLNVGSKDVSLVEKYGHASASTEDGRLIVFGGFGQSAVKGAHTGRHERVGDMVEIVLSKKIKGKKNGRDAVGEGERDGGANSLVEVKERKVFGDIPSARMYCTLTQVHDGGIILIGGRGNPSQPFGDCYLLNTKNWFWIRLQPSFPLSFSSSSASSPSSSSSLSSGCPTFSPRFRHSAVSLHNGKYVAVFGGRGVEECTDSNDDHEEEGDGKFKEGHSGSEQEKVCDFESEKELVVAGQGKGKKKKLSEISVGKKGKRNQKQRQTKDVLYDDVCLFNIQTGMWVRVHIPQGKEERPSPRYAHAAVAVSDMSFIVYGGLAESRMSLDDVWRLDLKQEVGAGSNLGEKYIGTWRQMKVRKREGVRHPGPRFSHTMLHLPDVDAVCMVGGCSPFSKNDVWMLDLKGEVWHPIHLGEGRTVGELNREIMLMKHTTTALQKKVYRPRNHLDEAVALEKNKEVESKASQLQVGISFVSVGGGGLCFSFGTHLNGLVRGTIWLPIYVDESEVNASETAEGEEEEEEIKTSKQSLPIRLNGAQRRKKMSVKEVDAREMTADDFEEVVKRREPVVLRGAMDRQMGDQAWSAEMLLSHYRDANPLASVRECYGTQLNFIHKNFTFKTMPFGELPE